MTVEATSREGTLNALDWPVIRNSRTGALLAGHPASRARRYTPTIGVAITRACSGRR
jgi:hypothetical protein